VDPEIRGGIPPRVLDGRSHGPALSNPAGEKTALEKFRAGVAQSLFGLRDAGLLRRMSPPRGVDLVSNDYLGLSGHPHLIEAMRAALAELGAGPGGSRLLRGDRRVFEKLEERLAAFCGAEAALLFVSGYAASTGLLQALAGPGDVVLRDAACHASLVDGIRLSGAREVVYPHVDLQAVEDALRKAGPARAFVVTESLFGMEGDQAPLAQLASLADRHGALLVVSEAHATGLHGPRGAGRVEELGLRDRVLATVHSGGKALGSGGGWVAGPAVVRDWLVNRARPFFFATAPLPVLAPALEAGLDVVEREPERRREVRRKAAWLRRALRDAGLDARGDSAIVPLVVGSTADALGLGESLAEVGFDVRAIRPPTVPEGTSRLRLAARYPVPDADLKRFVAETTRLARGRGFV
jgi:8-amino-7-oxononanoate synthase